MSGVRIGPLVFDPVHAAAIAGLLVFLVVIELAEARARRRGSGAPLGRWGTILVLATLIAARAGHVVGHAAVFAAHPLDALKLWQGGFDGVWGAAAATLVIAVALLRRTGAAKPLMIAAVLGAATSGTIRLTQGPAGDGGSVAGITLADLAGTPVALDARAGKPLVVNLWASWCGPCRREMPMMMELAAAHPGVDVIFANQGEDPGRIAVYLATEQLPEAGIVLDPTQSLQRRFGAIGLPTTLVFDAEGRLLQGAVGELSRAEFTAHLTRLTQDPN